MKIIRIDPSMCPRPKERQAKRTYSGHTGQSILKNIHHVPLSCHPWEVRIKIPKHLLWVPL